MAVGTYVERYRTWRFEAFTWRDELSVTKKVALAVGMACVTGLLAQVRIYLDFTPVPITGQNLGVLASGVMLGPWFGALSMLFYLAIGACGVPWFAGGHGRNRLPHPLPHTGLPDRIRSRGLPHRPADRQASLSPQASGGSSG